VEDPVLVAFAPIAGHHILAWLLIGLVSGAIASRVVGGGGLGFVRDIITGLVGAVIGGLIHHAVRGGPHASTSLLAEIVVAFAGAVLLLLLERVVTHRSARRI
jgi:uncharacterized membrane protein YeaQ/YmgE (transglycosylase-associated protein family)